MKEIDIIKNKLYKALKVFIKIIKMMLFRLESSPLELETIGINHGDTFIGPVYYGTLTHHSLKSI